MHDLSERSGGDTSRLRMTMRLDQATPRFHSARWVNFRNSARHNDDHCHSEEGAPASVRKRAASRAPTEESLSGTGGALRARARRSRKGGAPIQQILRSAPSYSARSRASRGASLRMTV